MRKTVRRPGPGLLATTILTAGGLLAGCGSEAPQGAEPAAEPRITAEAESSASWLVDQLEDGLVVSSFEDPPGSGSWTKSPDYGLSLDVFFALDGVDLHEGERAEILAALEEATESYIGSGEDAYAGSTGKLLTAVEAAEVVPAEYGDGNLVPRLERLVQSAGPEQGRAKDTWAPTNEYGGDYSNTIGQSWVVRALTAADSEVAEETVQFLLGQQCADGYFRLLMESPDFTCDGGTKQQSKPSADATAFAVQALLAVRAAGDGSAEEEIDEALTRAGEWLVSAQATDGSFADGDTGAANANSTGVAAEALDALGEAEAAEDAVAWLTRHLATADRAEGTKLSGEEGAVAFDTAALERAERRGISRGELHQWRRSTAQAVAALDSAPGSGD